MIDHAERLNRDERRHRHERNHAECVRMAAAGLRSAERKGQHKGRSDRAGGHAAGIKRDRREQIRTENHQQHRDGVSRRQNPHQVKSGRHAPHREGDRGGGSDRKKHKHQLPLNRAAGNRLHLLRQHPYGRLRADDDRAQQQPRADQQNRPRAAALRGLFAEDCPQLAARGNESAVHAGQKNREADKAPHETRRHSRDLMARHSEQKNLEHDEQKRERRDGKRRLLCERRNHREKNAGRLLCGGRRGGRARSAAGRKQNAVQQHRQHRPHRGDAGKSEIVAPAVLPVAAPAARCADTRHAHAQRQNKRHCHRAGRSAAGIKRDADKFRRREKRQRENYDIAEQQDDFQRPLQHGAHQTEHDENAHARGDHVDEVHFVHGRKDGADLIAENLNVRLRNGDEKADHKRD